MGHVGTTSGGLGHRLLRGALLSLAIKSVLVSAFAETGLEPHDALHAIGSVLMGRVLDLTQGGLKGDLGEVYIQELAELSAKKWRSGDRCLCDIQAYCCDLHLHGSRPPSSACLCCQLSLRLSLRAEISAMITISQEAGHYIWIFKVGRILIAAGVAQSYEDAKQAARDASAWYFEGKPSWKS
jgi:hypothetical protein